MKIIDEILPKVKAEVRLDKDNKTLWIKTDTLEGYGRIIIEDGANWCRIFYEECGECAHNDAEHTDAPTISKMEQVDEPQYEMGMGTLKCDNCSEYGSFKCTKCDGEMYFKRLEPKDEPQTERSE